MKRRSFCQATIAITALPTIGDAAQPKAEGPFYQSSITVGRTRKLPGVPYWDNRVDNGETSICWPFHWDGKSDKADVLYDDLDSKGFFDCPERISDGVRNAFRVLQEHCPFARFAPNTTVRIRCVGKYREISPGRNWQRPMIGRWLGIDVERFGYSDPTYIDEFMAQTERECRLPPGVIDGVLVCFGMVKS